MTIEARNQADSALQRPVLSPATNLEAYMTRQVIQMSPRRSTLYSILAIALVALPLLPFEAGATNDTLYGLTYDGYLVQINTTDASPTLVSTLPSSNQPYHSLTFYNGDFLATAGPILPGGGCSVVAFGVNNNDLVYKGTVSGLCPRTLAVDSNSNLYTGGTSTCSPHSCLQLKQLDPTTFAITNVASQFTFLTDDSPPVDGLAFVGSTSAYMTNVANRSERLNYRQLTLASGSWSSTYNSYGYLYPGTHGLAYNSSTSSLYSADGYDEYDNSVNTSHLWFINSPYTGSAGKTNLGTVTSYPGMVGITFAPAANQISSPPQPTGAKRLEPIRRLLLD
jgi:hypothetical protein